MADITLSSPLKSRCERRGMSLVNQENIASSPLRSANAIGTTASGQKIRKPPTVTPKRFTKFFTPRDTASSRGSRQSKAGRQLRDITKNGANRRRGGLLCSDDLIESASDHVPSTRAIKRRKISTEFDSSPPQSSPLKHIRPVGHDLAPLSPTVSEADTLSDLLEDMKPFPKPIRRLREAGSSRRLLERSFGGHEALSRGRRGADHATDGRAITANFYTTPADVHAFRGTALPFCTTACNTNCLVAIGDEEGSVRLIDSSADSEFQKAHIKFRVHHNAVMDIAFSSDDYVLATASGDQTARIVDMQSQQTVCILTGHKSSVKHIKFRPDNDNLITTSARDGTVQFWDLRCGSKSAVQNFRASSLQLWEGGERVDPEPRYSQRLDVGCGHKSVHRSYNFENRDELSVTSFRHIPHGREHLILTASEVDASVKLWDIRNANRQNPVPLSSTPVPQSHKGNRRHYGINALALSGDGARLYTVCRDATVYTYSTNQIVLGYAPEMSAGPSRRRMLKEPKAGLAPLYAFRHPLLRLSTFYVKASLRPANGEHGELLAVGSTDRCPILFPTDERYLPRRTTESRARDYYDEHHDDDDDDEDMDLPTFAPSAGPQSSRSPPPSMPIYEHGTALVRGHSKEVTSPAWTSEGNLISVSDDFTARCWREDAQKARELRQMGEVGGGRWRAGWAEADASWDEEEG